MMSHRPTVVEGVKRSSDGSRELSLEYVHVLPILLSTCPITCRLSLPIIMGLTLCLEPDQELATPTPWTSLSMLKKCTKQHSWRLAKFRIVYYGIPVNICMVCTAWEGKNTFCVQVTERPPPLPCVQFTSTLEEMHIPLKQTRGRQMVFRTQQR